MTRALSDTPHDVDPSAVWDHIGSKQPYPTGCNRTTSDRWMEHQVGGHP